MFTPLAFLASVCDEHALDALIFQDLRTIRYLCGFTGTDGVLLYVGGQLHFLTDGRYGSQAREQAAADVVVYQDKIDAVTEALSRLGVRRLGYEGDVMTVSQLHRYQIKGGTVSEWVPLARELRPLRMVKTDEELATLEAAAALHLAGWAAIEPLLRPGVRECDIAFALEVALRKAGGEDRAFDFIVASGVRGALPHGVASTKVLQGGELVTIDFGTRCRGYHSDETVTVGLGAVDEELQGLHALVLEAHDQALAAVRPGVPLKEIDAVAREVIRGKGYDKAFVHGLGHGVGLEIHEPPVVSSRSEDVATVNMVFTVEPGVYLEGLGGVRIEDTVVVTEQGCRCITQLPKTYRAYPI